MTSDLNLAERSACSGFRKAALRAAIVELHEGERRLHDFRLPGEQTADAYLDWMLAEAARDGRCFPGIVVSLGHSEATAEEAEAVFDAGARAVTHLYNTISQLSSRAPGVVGATLSDPRVVCGLIADGEHARPAAYRAAIAAKGPRGVALISDAMPPAAGGPDVFELQGRRMIRVGHKLVDENGRLAGAAITMRDAVRYVALTLGLPLVHALTMATLTPARLLGVDDQPGPPRARLPR